MLKEEKLQRVFHFIVCILVIMAKTNVYFECSFALEILGVATNGKSNISNIFSYIRYNHR